jgi:calcineurin-like phosphoesterase
VATGTVQICGVYVDVDEASGRALAIRRIQETVSD